jgi:ribose transport system substrate-binding protein
MKALLATTAITVALTASTGSALAETSDKRIALSNNYAGNSWRQAMLRSWETVTKKAVEDGVVAAADAFTTAENQVTEQAAQIQNLVLQGYDAVVVNAASPDALNGAVKEACDAGVTVVSFDGIVTEPCAWRIAVDFKQMGKDEVLYLKDKLPEAAISWRSAASPAFLSMTRSPRAFTRAWRRIRSSRSSAPSMVTGIRR